MMFSVTSTFFRWSATSILGISAGATGSQSPHSKTGRSRRDRAHSQRCSFRGLFCRMFCHECQHDQVGSAWSTILWWFPNLANCVNISWLRSALPGFWNVYRDTISLISASLCTVFLEVGLHMVFICKNRMIRAVLYSYSHTCSRGLGGPGGVGVWT